MSRDDNLDQSGEFRKQPRGMFSTLCFAMIIFIAGGWAGNTAIKSYVHYRAKMGDVEAPWLGRTNGLAYIIFECAAAPVMILLTVLLAGSRKGIGVKESLGLRPIAWPEAARWAVAAMLLVFFADGLAWVFGRPLITMDSRACYGSAGSVPLFWFVSAILGPVRDTVLFWGFLFKGIENSRFGAVGAAILTSLFWSTLTGVNQEAYAVMSVFASGALLGLARYRSNSLYATFVVYLVFAVISLVELAVFAGSAGP